MSGNQCLSSGPPISVAGAEASTFCEKISRLSPVFSSQPGLAELISSSWNPEEQFLIHLNCYFKKRPCPVARDEERGLPSMPWIDEVWIKLDIEISSVVENHLDLCNICVRILSNVTFVEIFSNLSRDYFR